MENEDKKASLLDRWKNRDQKKPNSSNIPKAPDHAHIALSNAQQRLWFLQQLYPGNAFYNLSEYYIFKGPLNTDILKKSLSLLFDKHVILKSHYPLVDGIPILKINNNHTPNFTEEDYSLYTEDKARTSARAFMDEQARYGFNLSTESLIKIAILKIRDDEHILFLTLHHIITDQWSLNIFKDQLSHNYKKLSEGSNIDINKTHSDINFLDYAYWQSGNHSYNDQITYWKNKLSADIPRLNLPLDFRRPITPSFKGRKKELKFSEELSVRVLSLAKKLEVTPFVLFLSAYYLLIHKFTKQEDILIGSPVSNRSQKSLENVFGLFINTVVFRTTINNSLILSEFIKGINKMSLEAIANKDIPFDTLVKAFNVERSLSTNPFFQVMFVYTSISVTPDFGNDVTLIENSEYHANVSKFDLTLFVTENKGLVSASFEYATDLFEEATINRFLNQIQQTLDYIVKYSSTTIESIPFLDKNDEIIISSNNNFESNPFDSYQNIHSVIEKIANQYPGNLALTYKGISINYKELNDRANIVASELLKISSNQNEIVGLCIERSIDMIVGLLGILKAGCAYLPIDPEYPIQRIDYILNDAKVTSIVTQKKLLHLFDGFKTETLTIDVIDNLNWNNDVKFPKVKESDYAYIIYTSGSTGKPKGVPITHKNILSSTGGRLSFYEKKPESFLLMSSISFDSSKAGIFWTLCTGGNLVISEKRLEQDIDKIGDMINDHRVTHILILPSLHKLLLEYVKQSKLKTLSTVIVAGETCSTVICKRHLNLIPNVDLYNEYGPTEASVWCTAHKVSSNDLNLNQIPIGKPVANAKIFILNEDKGLCPFGVVGEIYIGGPGLSNGYINRPELTNRLFIESPYNSEEKLYRTGDMGVYRNDGSIQFLGRSDQQVKLRGFRVELNEIEDSIRQFKNGIQEVIVVVEGTKINEVKDQDTPRVIVAYVKGDSTLDLASLNVFIKTKLPKHMVPSNIYKVDDFPYLPNGKLDKPKLQEIRILDDHKIDDISLSVNKEIIAPENDIEKNLIGIWEEILGISPISVKDNFFEIGGDSILSIQVIAKTREIGIKLRANELFENQNIRDLSRTILKNQNIEKKWSFVTTIREEGHGTPLFCIHSGGGHVFFYGLLKDYLKSDRPIYALQPSGINSGEKLHKSIEEMSKDYLDAIREIQPHGPYNILVYCFSVSVGNEMSILLDQTNEKINVIVIDTMVSAWNATDINTIFVRTLSFIKRVFINPIKTLKLFYQERAYILHSLTTKFFGKSYEKELERLKANLRKISYAYKWKPHNGMVSLILTYKPDKKFQNHIIQSWEKMAKGGVDIYYTKGHHTSLFEKKDIKYVSEKIDQAIKD